MAKSKIANIGQAYHKAVLGIVLSLLVIPVVATLIYSLSTRWGATVIPDGFTLNWYLQLWTDQRFLMALLRSLLLCFSTLVISVLIITPAIFVIFYYLPNLKKYLSFFVILPFALPPVVCSIGLLQIYSSDILQLTGTPYILIGTYFTIALPLILQTLINRLQALKIVELMDAAHLLGASSWQAFVFVVLPNIRFSIASSFMLAFSFLLGEFVFANLLVGTNFETLQVYLYNMRQISGHFTSAIVISYFAIILLFTWLANRLNK